MIGPPINWRDRESPAGYWNRGLLRGKNLRLGELSVLRCVAIRR
jgi:hypothetical protein